MRTESIALRTAGEVFLPLLLAAAAAAAPLEVAPASLRILEVDGAAVTVRAAVDTGSAIEPRVRVVVELENRTADPLPLSYESREPGLGFRLVDHAGRSYYDGERDAEWRPTRVLAPYEVMRSTMDLEARALVRDRAGRPGFERLRGLHDPRAGEVRWVDLHLFVFAGDEVVELPAARMWLHGSGHAGVPAPPIL